MTIYVISQEPGGMYWSTAAGVQQQQLRSSTALSSKRQQCHGYRIVGHYGSLQINLLTRCQRLYTSCLHCSAFLATPSIFVLLTPAFWNAWSQCLFHSSWLLGQFTSPSLSVLSLLHSLPFAPLQVGPFPYLPPLTSMPPIAARRSWERISSPSGSGRSPAAKRILLHFKYKSAPVWLLNFE